MKRKLGGENFGSSKTSQNPFTGAAYTENYYKLLEQRQNLPVTKYLDELTSLLASNDVVIVEGETGSGKTTQIPQHLANQFDLLGDKVIACTQPRRVAAMSIAQRVAEEMDVQLGSEVGYTIRFEDRTNEKTCLKFLTDGMLLRESMHDPTLSGYSVILLDEAHERTLSTDVLMGLLKEIMSKKECTLKLVVMSATLDAKKFQTYFDGAPILKVPGRTFPVDVYFTPQPERDYVEAAVKTVMQIHRHEDPGDILVFLTGQQEIDQVCNELYEFSEEIKQESPELGELMVVPLYSNLPVQQQRMIFDKAPGPIVSDGRVGRKVVVSTNIAETSLTIDGIVYVVDPGFCKQKVYNPRIRVESLLVSPISRASARQRAGRAGRTQHGKVFRLYTEDSFKNDLTEQTYPEILRSNLGKVVLTLLKLGIKDLVHFDFIDPPAPETLMRALELLNYLGALSDEGDVTTIGMQMAELPVEPEMAKMILSSAQYGCSNEIVTIAALLSVPPVFMRPPDKGRFADIARKQFEHIEGDHLSLLNAFSRYKESGCDKKWCFDNFLQHRNLVQADSIRDQLTRILKTLNVPLVSLSPGTNIFIENIQKCLISGYFMQVAFLEKFGTKSYKTVKDNQLVTLHPSCCLNYKPDWVLYNEFMLTTKNYLRTVTKISGEWLVEIAPHYFDLENFPEGVTKDELKSLYSKQKDAKKLKKKKKK